MKRFVVQMMFVLAAMVFLSSCASHNEFGQTNNSSNAQPVPGEKVSGEGSVTPTAGGAGAGARVGW